MRGGSVTATQAALATEVSTGTDIGAAPAAFRALRAIVAKDLRLELRRVEGLATVAIFALLVALMFVFAGDPSAEDLRRLGPGALWIALLFAGVLGFARWFAQEERNSALQGLLLTPVDRGVLFAGKWLGATLFLLALEAVLVPVTLTMYGLTPGRPVWGWLGLLLVVVTAGYAVLGTFFAAVAARTTAGELLLPVLLFPLSVPLVLAGAEGAQALFAGNRADYWDWLGLAGAFDLLFGTVCTLVFEHVIED
jgi:heme exporter protein B